MGVCLCVSTCLWNNFLLCLQIECLPYLLLNMNVLANFTLSDNYTIF